MLGVDLDKFVQLMEEMLEELRAIRALLEKEYGRVITIQDNATWTGQPSDD